MYFEQQRRLRCQCFVVLTLSMFGSLSLYLIRFLLFPLCLLFVLFPPLVFSCAACFEIVGHGGIDVEGDGTFSFVCNPSMLPL